MKITELISPIKLLKGTHDDTAKTGQGCFMNVIAYLNGEPQITDQSPCVCYVVRPIAVFLNDYLRNDERHLLIPYIERAMGSRTDDREEISRRLKLVVELANYQAKYAKYAKSAAKSAAEYAAKSAAEYAKYAAKSAEYAKYAAKYAKYAKSAAEYAKSAAEYAKYAAEYAKYAALRQDNTRVLLKFMDEALPKAIEHSPIVTQRAIELMSVSKGELTCQV